MATLLFATPTLQLKENIIVVGSSGSMKNSAYGKHIDRFSEVVRFNRALTKGFENFVGRRTTLRLVNSHVYQNKNLEAYGFDGQPQGFIGEIKNSKILLYSMGGEDAVENGKKYWHSSNKFFWINYQLASSLKKNSPLEKTRDVSVGIIFLRLLIESGFVPFICGFDLASEARSHYWEQRPQISKNHKITHEQEWLAQMINQGKLKVL